MDKDAHVCRLLSAFLAEGGYAPQCLHDGYAALDEARRDPPAVVVTEILLPRLDGLSLCRLIKGDDATRDARVLVLSMLNAEARALGAGADAFMKKPIERRALLDALRALLPAPTKEPAE